MTERRFAAFKNEPFHVQSFRAKFHCSGSLCWLHSAHLSQTIAKGLHKFSSSNCSGNFKYHFSSLLSRWDPGWSGNVQQFSHKFEREKCIFHFLFQAELNLHIGYVQCWHVATFKSQDWDQHIWLSSSSRKWHHIAHNMVFQCPNKGCDQFIFVSRNVLQVLSDWVLFYFLSPSNTRFIT